MDMEISRQFPSLDFARRADEYLKSIAGVPIRQQLQELGVSFILVCDMKSLGALDKIGETFFISIKKSITSLSVTSERKFFLSSSFVNDKK